MILLTGVAGFIGSHVARVLLDAGHTVIGVDSINDYYDPALKHARLGMLEGRAGFTFQRIDIADRAAMRALGERYPDMDAIIHLAAQAGVRYSIDNPYAYLDSNLAGQMTMLELARHARGLRHFVYASSSSVYGNDTSAPFALDARCDKPVSLYAATKRAGELLAHSYAELYAIPATGLRFFTVYGPWGRPDMAYFSFTRNILESRPIKVFNNGDLKRDFTYIDDIVAGVIAALETPPQHAPGGAAPHRVFNLGNHRPVKLLDFITAIETAAGKKAVMEMTGMAPGDVYETCADITESQKILGFEPKTTLESGIPKFVDWYRDFYK
ncbi:MAG: NAD-dependent epimerase/dehydratase family protein [Rhodospirillales bacterium]|nr:NAD-dependent epimerase/dehydratase family protein [Alphaproteobacteria bacterium]MCB9986647.1 NAD-dependent epimerase/dehydratase family protein [Rhodospirillales bacterium]USO06825.1 MAG: NAD-dependent epimerase/dehydratase family protein [Rhodospirillales bacterium]